MNSHGAVPLGSQRPRFRTAPQEPANSWGPEAVDLAATVGLHLDEGQANVLIDGMSHHADDQWAASEVADDEPRQNGKGSILEARALAGLYLLKEPLIVWTAHEFKTAYEGFLRMRGHIDNFDHLRKRVKAIRSSTHAVEVEMLGGQRLAFLARSGGSGRGFAGVAPLFLDEAFALTEEQMAALIFAMSAHPNPQVWYMSSAPLINSAVFRSICVRGRKGSPGLVYYEWSASGDYADLFRLVEQNKHLSTEDEQTPAGRQLRRRLFEKVAEANRAFNVRISASSILRELAATGVEQFLRERLGVWSETEAETVVDMGRWSKLADLDPVHPADVTFAVRVSPDRSKVFIGYAGRRADGRYLIGLSDKRDMVHGTAERIAELRGKHDPVAVVVDAWSERLTMDLAKLGIEPSEKPDEPQRGDLVVPKAADTAAAFGVLIDALNADTLRHVDDQVLNGALRVAKAKSRAGGRAWDGSTENAAALEAVTLALWAFEARAHLLVDSDYDVADSVY